MTADDVKELLGEVERTAPEKPYIGSDEWDLCDAFQSGWDAAFDAAFAAIKKAEAESV